jgi:hypothetical protein
VSRIRAPSFGHLTIRAFWPGHSCAGFGFSAEAVRDLEHQASKNIAAHLTARLRAIGSGGRCRSTDTRDSRTIDGAAGEDARRLQSQQRRTVVGGIVGKA